MNNKHTSPIKVAFVIGGLPFGGVENWLLDLMMALRGQTHIRPYIINVSGTGQLMKTYQERGFDVICIGNGKQSISTHRIDTILSLRNTLKKLDVDIIHTLHFSGDFFGRLASMGLGIPVATHIRNMKSERKLKRRMFNKLLSWATTQYLAVSQAAAATINREHNLAGRPVQVIYNAVDPAKLAVEPIDLYREFGIQGRVVIGVGRLVKQKNFDKLMRAMEIVRKDIDDVSLLILGDGGEMESLKALRSDLSLEKVVHLTGFINNADVPRFLRASHLLAMPSDYEGLPITHVEAMFCGLPAVISEYVPSIEIAEDSSLVCTTDVEDIADNLHHLLSDQALYDQMSNAALKSAQQYSIQNYLRQLSEIYSQLLVQ